MVSRLFEDCNDIDMFFVVLYRSCVVMLYRSCVVVCASYTATIANTLEMTSQRRGDCVCLWIMERC